MVYSYSSCSPLTGSPTRSGRLPRRCFLVGSIYTNDSLHRDAERVFGEHLFHDLYAPWPSYSGSEIQEKLIVARREESETGKA